jgi:hypothetical protein
MIEEYKIRRTVKVRERRKTHAFNWDPDRKTSLGKTRNILEGQVIIILTEWGGEMCVGFVSQI